MKPIADSAGAATNEAPDQSDMMAAATAKTGLVAREIPGTKIDGLRCQLGEIILADVVTNNAALKYPHREMGARFFLLRAWGPTWSAAASNWSRKQNPE